VFVVEGEKCVDALWDIDVPATTNSQGAGKWRDDYSNYLRGRHVVILPDADGPGYQHAEGVARSLNGIAASVRIIELPGLPHKGDVFDWLAAGGDKNKLLQLAAATVQPPSEENQPSPNNNQANGSESKPRVRELMVRSLSAVNAVPTTWLWRYYIPLGTVTILDGDPGLGKSTITADLAARVSRGGAMPPLAGYTDLDGPADVLILNAEDAPEQTIRPRLDAAGADPEKVHVIDATKIGEDDERPPVLPKDLDLIGEQARERGVKLIIVDPFMAYLDGELDAHRDQDVRRCLHRLKILAESTGAAVLLVRHLNKLTGGPAIYRGGGSVGISGAARSVLMVARNPADPKQFVFAPIKCNLCVMPPALTYSIATADNGMSLIGWGQETTMSADQLLGCNQQKTSVAEECVELIRTLLADGPRPAAEMEEELKANGFSPNAIRDGRKRANVRPVKDGFEGRWRWELPNEKSKDGPDEDVTIPPGW
jgi:hypothetical protein